MGAIDYIQGKVWDFYLTCDNYLSKLRREDSDQIHESNRFDFGPFSRHFPGSPFNPENSNDIYD